MIRKATVSSSGSLPSLSSVTHPTILVSSWTDGVFATTGSHAVQELAGQPVRALGRAGNGGVLAIVDGHSLCRRAPGGKWSTVAVSDHELSCWMDVRGQIYAGTEDASLLLLNPAGEFIHMDAFQQTPGRETWYAGSAIVNGVRMGPPLGIRSLAASADGRVLFANVHVGGIPRSTNGGRSWQPTIAIHTDVHEVRAHPEDPDMVVAACAAGLCISDDAGATWVVEQDGLHAPYCSAVAFTGDHILVSAATDHFAASGRVYRRPLNGPGTITPITEWTGGIVDTHCLATDGPHVAIVDAGGTLHQSADSGLTWTKNPHLLPPPGSVLIC